MTRVRAAVVVVGALAIAFVVTFPPYMVIDQAAPQTRHSGLGHHPLWSPPTPAGAEEVLLERIGPPPAGVASSLDVRRNSVLFTAEIGLIFLLVSGAWIFGGRRSRPCNSVPVR